MTDFIKTLESRDMIHDMIPGTQEQLNKEITSGYIGFDLTAPSLHIGNLASIMLLKHFQICGHKPIAVVGGATTQVGDPGGKTKERDLLPIERIIENQKSIRKQLENLLDFDCGKNSAELYNNLDWHKDFRFLNFLREVGKNIPIGYMLAKDSVKNRLEKGISFAEFSYQLIQGYDFYYLYKNKGIKLQMGGSDQWGNLTTGTELIKRKDSGDAYAVTTPLITKSDGTKFGKSESGSIWLDPNMTSPYKFYQFWLNTADDDAMRYIKVFTTLPLEKIKEIINSHNENPHLRLLQKTLAAQVTEFIHSREELNKAERASEILFGKDTHEKLKEIDEKTFLDVFEGVEIIDIQKDKLFSINNMTDLLTSETGNIIFKSKGEVRRSIDSGGVYLNKKKLITTEISQKLDLLADKYLLVQKGKKNYYIISALS